MRVSSCSANNLRVMPQPRREFYDEATIWDDDTPLGSDLISRAAEQKLKWTAAAIVLGAALGVGGIFAAGAGTKGLIWLTLSVLGILGIVALATYLEAGLALFLAFGWLLFKTPGIAQGQGGGGEQGLAVSQLGLLVLLAAWLLRRLFRQEERLYKSPINGPIATYLFLCVWSTAHSLLFPDRGIESGVIAKTPLAVNFLEVILRVLALGGLLLVANAVTAKRKALLAGMFVLAGVSLFLFTLKAGPENVVGPAKGLGTFLPSQGYGFFPQMLMLGALASLVLHKIGPLWLRVLMGTLALAMFGWAFIKNAEWVSGWFCGGVALTIVIFNTQRKVFWIGAGVLALIVLVRFDYFYDKIYKMNFYQGGYMSWGTRTLKGQEIGTFENDRTRMIRAAFLYAETFPLGVGLGNYKNFNHYYGSPEVWNTTVFTSAHGTYAQTLSELGWLGLLSLFWLQVAVLRTLYRLYRAMPPGWEKAWLLATFAGTAGIFCSALMGDYLFPAYHNGGMRSFGGTVYTWLLIGFGLALARLQGLQWDVLTGRARPRVAPQALWQRALEDAA